MKRCAWCQEESNLVPVVNRDPMSLSGVDLVCSACVEVERFEHAEELLWSPLGFTPIKQRRARTTCYQDDLLAS